MISKSELILEIQTAAKNLRRNPTTRDFRHRQWPVKKYFGTWNNALSAAGLEVNRKRYSKMKMIRLLQRFNAENGRPPTTHDFESGHYDLPNRGTVQSLFGTYHKALQSAGLQPNIAKAFRGDQWSDQTVFDLFASEYFRINPKSQEEYNDNRSDLAPSASYLKSRFNLSWTELVKKIGAPESSIQYKNLDENEVFQVLHAVAKKLERPPSLSEFNQAQKIIDGSTLKKKYGGWNSFLAAAGVEPGNATPAIVTETKEELISMYQNFSKAIGRDETGATAREMDTSDEIHNSDVFIIRFGSLNDLRLKSGFQPLYPKKKYSLAAIKEELKKIYIQKGPVTNAQIKNIDELPSIRTILTYFQTTKMGDVWKAIGDEVGLVGLMDRVRAIGDLSGMEISEIHDAIGGEKNCTLQSLTSCLERNGINIKPTTPPKKKRGGPRKGQRPAPQSDLMESMMFERETIDSQIVEDFPIVDFITNNWDAFKAYCRERGENPETVLRDIKKSI